MPQFLRNCDKRRDVQDQTSAQIKLQLYELWETKRNIAHNSNFHCTNDHMNGFKNEKKNQKRNKITADMQFYKWGFYHFKQS